MEIRIAPTRTGPLPRTPVRQPAWSSERMRDDWRSDER